MNTAKDFVPSLTGQQTTATLQDQGYTYNQAGFTYNQTGADYGGLYKVNQDFVPVLTTARIITPSLTVQNTLRQRIDQGYTYNQAGFSYNQPGVDYGGIYNLFDIIPVISVAKQIIASMVISGNFTNTYTRPPVFNAQLLPIGLPFYFLTYP